MKFVFGWRSEVKRMPLFLPPSNRRWPVAIAILCRAFNGSQFGNTMKEPLKLTSAFDSYIPARTRALPWRSAAAAYF
jgi:hypothetical protein